MGAVDFGTFITEQSNVAATARRVEELGYDVLACGEHVMFYGPVTNSYVTLAVAAGATSRIKLMSGIVLLPLYPAALAAKLGAALDVASGGRYLFGVGVGGEYPKEFEACGIPVTERGARTNEALEVITRLWTEENVSFDGRFNTLSDATINPRPVQAPHPPIWVAGRQEAAMRRAARYASGWLPYMYTPEQLHGSIEKVEAMASDEGRSLEGFKTGAFLWSVVHEDGARAHETAVEFLSKNYSQDFTKLVSKYAVAGDPDQVEARIREYIDAGAELVVLPPACLDPGEAEASVTLMAESVIPALRG